MPCRRSSPTADGCHPSKQEPDVLDANREKCRSSPTATAPARHSSGPALASSGNTATEDKGGERRESGSPPSLTNAASADPAGSAPDPEMEHGDRFEIVNRDNGPPAVSAGAATSRPSSASATITAAPVEGRPIPAFNFSFAMGGWLMFYSFGVAKCLLDHGLHKVRPTQQRFIGSSAGSLAAAALALEADIDKASAIACAAWEHHAVCMCCEAFFSHIGIHKKSYKSTSSVHTGIHNMYTTCSGDRSKD